MADDGERLAIIREARREVDDHGGQIALTFSTYINESQAAMQVVHAGTDPRFLSLWRAMGDSIDSLNGQPCWVDVSRPGLIVFVRMWGDKRG